MKFERKKRKIMNEEKERNLTREIGKGRRYVRITYSTKNIV